MASEEKSPAGDRARRPGWHGPRPSSVGIPIEGGVNASFKRIIESAPDPEAKRKEIVARLKRLTSFAETLGVTDLVGYKGQETRPRLIPALEWHSAPSITRR